MYFYLYLIYLFLFIRILDFVTQKRFIVCFISEINLIFVAQKIQPSTPSVVWMKTL